MLALGLILPDLDARDTCDAGPGCRFVAANDVDASGGYADLEPGNWVSCRRCAAIMVLDDDRRPREPEPEHAGFARALRHRLLAEARIWAKNHAARKKERARERQLRREKKHWPDLLRRGITPRGYEAAVASTERYFERYWRGELDFDPVQIQRVELIFHSGMTVEEVVQRGGVKKAAAYLASRQ